MQTIFRKFIGFFFFFYVLVFQGQNIQLTNYSLKDGLPQSQINALIQDDVGFIWSGTEGGGLSSFDGANFKVWNKSNGLLSNYVNDIKWFDGKLYIATSKGLSVMEGNKFVNFESDAIFKLAFGNKGLYLATKKGVKYFDGKTVQNFVFDEAVSDIQFYDNILWLATKIGIYKLSIDLDKQEDLKPFIKGSFESVHIHENKIYAIKENIGVAIFDINGKISKTIINYDKVNNLAIINNDFWVSTQNSGVLQLNSVDYSLMKRYNQASGISNVNIQKVLKDRQQNLWFASNGAGLYKLKEHSFQLLFKGNEISAVSENENGIWISSEKHLTKIDSFGLHDKSFGIRITSIVNSRQATYVGTSNGIFILDSLKIIDTLNIDKGFVSNNIQKIVLVNNKIWVAFKNKGISSFSYDLTTKSVFNRINFNKKDGLYDMSMQDIVVDESEKLWYVTKNGYFGFIESNKLKHQGLQLNSSIKVLNLLIHDNKLFVGTDGGGVWVSNLSKELAFKNLTKGNNLNFKKINQLLFDAENNLWLGTQNGVYRMQFNSNYDVDGIRYYGYNDGFISAETTHGTAFKDKNSNLYFGTTKGLITSKRYSSSNKIDEKLPIKFLNVEVVYNSIDTINLKHWTNSNKKLQLNPFENHISFSYKSVDINNPKKINYRWRLNSNSWSLWTEEDKINFANLSSGQYIFEAESKTINNQKSETIRFNFSIATKLIDRVWFRLSVVGAFLCIVVLIVWNTVRKIKLKSIEKNEKLKLQHHLLELEHKALQLQMNPHFIFNVLNGIKAMSKTDITKMNTTINKFALLLRSTLNSSRKETISLQDEVNAITNYIEVEQLMREDSFEFNINIGDDIDTDEVMIPVMLIQPFVENAIKHGFSDKNKKGKLEVGFSIQSNSLHCEIKDNGIGFYHAKNKNDKADHQSVAINLSKERITALAGSNTLKIKEMKDIDSNVVGTCIHFTIPLLTDY